jgi:type IV pilus assembly protein PilA
VGRRVRERWKGEGGFTIVELLVAILIVGLLAGVVIPSFLSEVGKASDSPAKQLARTAQTTAGTYALDHEGTYEGMTAAALKGYEPSIQLVEGNGNAYLSAVTVEPGELGYVVTATAADGHTYSIKKKSSGQVLRTCVGCQNGTW